MIQQLNVHALPTSHDVVVGQHVRPATLVAYDDARAHRGRNVRLTLAALAEEVAKVEREREVFVALRNPHLWAVALRTLRLLAHSRLRGHRHDERFSSFSD